MKSSLLCLMLLSLLSGVALADLSSSEGAVEGFYDWYLKAGDRYRDNFSQAESFLTPELYDLLARGFAQSPEDSFWVDFDPFANAQMPLSKVSVGKPYTAGKDLDMVKVTPFYERDSGPGSDIKVYCVKQGGEWKIANLVYTGDYPFSLKQFLSDGLKK